MLRSIKQYFSLKNLGGDVFYESVSGREPSRFCYEICERFAPTFLQRVPKPQFYFVRKIKLQGSVLVLGQNLISNSR